MAKREFASISVGGSDKGLTRIFAVAKDGTAWMAPIKLNSAGKEVPGEWEQLPDLPEEHKGFWGG